MIGAYNSRIAGLKPSESYAHENTNVLAPLTTVIV